MLIKCPECQHDVSDSAPTCPSCGYPLTPLGAEAAQTAADAQVVAANPFGNLQSYHDPKAQGARTKPHSALLGTGVIGLVLVLAVVGGLVFRPASSTQSTNAADVAAADANAAMASANAAENSAEAVAALPQHNWISHENGEYGYPVAISEDARKTGQAAEQVSMFRYLGVRNGVYTLASDDGMVATCSTPCTVISMSNGYSSEHIAYNTSSIIGAAFEDAMNGQLEAWQPPPPPPTPAYPPVGAPVTQSRPAPPVADNDVDPSAAG